MERDTKRAQDQWRGCHAFTDIICDGDGGNSPKRTGGLKMGLTYYYYYELDDGTEAHDPSIPFTTTCPYLPGQPVNLLYVPIEVRPVRYRSASVSSMTTGDVKTMNPAHKFIAPRPPLHPPAASLRSNTAISLPSSKRSARSVSPKSDRVWSPKMFFGLRPPPLTSIPDYEKRGRSESGRRGSEGRNVASKYTPPVNFDEIIRKSNSTRRARESHDTSSRSPRREASPLQSPSRESDTFNVSSVVIPDDIAEDFEDDDNFASQSNIFSLHSQGIFTQLSPPPSSGLRQSPSRRPSITNTSKPLPELPEDMLVPLPLRLHEVASTAKLPKPHFSVSTAVSSSPLDSHFDFNTEDEDDLIADSESGDDSTPTPVADDSYGRCFTGYSLPDDDYNSEKEIHTREALAKLTSPNSRATFGGPAAISARVEADMAKINSLEELLNEVGYLGDLIIGK